MFTLKPISLWYDNPLPCVLPFYVIHPHPHSYIFKVDSTPLNKDILGSNQLLVPLPGTNIFEGTPSRDRFAQLTHQGGNLVTTLICQYHFFLCTYYCFFVSCFIYFFFEFT